MSFLHKYVYRQILCKKHILKLKLCVDAYFLLSRLNIQTNDHPRPYNNKDFVQNVRTHYSQSDSNIFIANLVAAGCVLQIIFFSFWYLHQNKSRGDKSGNRGGYLLSLLPI